MFITKDGSYTLYSEHFQQHYHSVHGAVQESVHVFMEAGLKYFITQYQVKSVRIFEMGFGTGLNALLSLEIAKSLKINVDYYSIEKFPLPDKMVKLLKNWKKDENFDQIHQVRWNENVELDDYFSLKKIEADVFKHVFEDDYFDLIFYDAFAPSSQSELWSKEMMQKMFDILKPHGILVSYCAQGQFKRNLKSAGFCVEALPGPKGKREMVRAAKG